MFIEYTSKFTRDIKKLKKKRYPTDELKKVIKLIEINDFESQKILVQRHNKHSLTGNWSGYLECHVANIGDWLVVWQELGDTAVFVRTGSHDEIFK